MWLIFKNEMVTYQPKANIDEKFFPITTSHTTISELIKQTGHCAKNPEGGKQ